VTKPEFHDIDALYAAVVAAPDDEPARRVLADRLLEVGDPQGSSSSSPATRRR
jgi:uncharacterized protein (TIGR02996 family)